MTKFERDLCTVITQGYRLKAEVGMLKFVLKGINNLRISGIELPMKAKKFVLLTDIETVGQFLENMNKFTNMKGVGKQTLKETKMKLLNFAYDNMSKANREKFWKEILV